MKPKSIVLRVGGTNCDKETVNALNMAGFDTKLVHINELIRKEVNLLDFNLLVIPGGFSFGDYISAGKIFAVELQYKLKDVIEKFVLNKKNFVVGICNGFQVLVKLGVLPEISFTQQVTLTYNDSGKFECRWVYLKTNKNNPSPLKNLPEIIQLPIAHAEGKFYANNNVIDKIVKNNCILFQYCDKDGNIVNTYPYNPNGSLLNIAGITDTTGRIIALMPHPERYIIPQQHPMFYNEMISASNRIIAYGIKFFELIRNCL